MTAVTPKNLGALIAEARDLTEQARELARYVRIEYTAPGADPRYTVFSIFEKLDEIERALTQVSSAVEKTVEVGDYAAGWADRSRATATEDPETVALVAEHLRAARFRDRPSGRPIADTVFGHDDFTRRAAVLLAAVPHTPGARPS